MSNYHKAFLTIVIVILILLFCVACSFDINFSPPTNFDRFTYENYSVVFDDTYPMHIYIITDNESGEKYLFVRKNGDGGLTKL